MNSSIQIHSDSCTQVAFSRSAPTLLVLTDSHFCRDASGDVWVESECDSVFWDRYLRVFNKIIVCARFVNCGYSVDEVPKTWLKSSRERVSFAPLPDFRGAKGAAMNYLRVRSLVRKAITHSDCIICRLPSPTATIAMPIIERSGLPFALEVVVNPMTAFSKDSIKSFLQPLIQRVAVSQLKAACQKANGVAYVTERILQDLYPCKAFTKSNDYRYFTGSYSSINLDRSDYSAPRRLPLTGLRLVHVGVMGDLRKGQAVFLKTISLLREKGIDCRAVLVGDGAMRSSFEALALELGIGDVVSFRGWLPGPLAVREVLDDCHIMVFPTASEGLPRCVIEAMARGVLCLGSGVDGMPELLGPRCISGSNTAEDYYRKISWFLEHPDDTFAEVLSQFETARRYESSILKERRNAFYSSLRELVLRNAKAEVEEK